MNLLSLFSGIGAFEKALEKLNIDYNLVGFSEINPYAIKSYCSIHQVDESLNLGNITSINIPNINSKVDLLTYSFPCQDISLAGKRIGLIDKDGSKTRSGLFFDALKIIEEKKPKIAIAENVKGLVTKRFKPQFDIVLQSLEEAGYNNYWKVLNSKDYGVPQNRERVFIISVRKDIDNNKFEFPEPIAPNIRLADILEESVDEKYYLPKEKVNTMVRFCNPPKNSYELEQVGYINTYNGDANRVYNTNLARTLKAEAGGGGAKTGWYEVSPNVVRKLTPEECWILTGFDPEDCDKTKTFNTETNAYKQAGNSIVVNVLYYIFIELYKTFPKIFEKRC